MGKGTEVFENYLAQTIDLSREPAIVSRDGKHWTTLDGTPVVPIERLAQEKGLSLEAATKAFDQGKIEGVVVGTQRWASKTP